MIDYLERQGSEAALLEELKRLERSGLAGAACGGAEKETAETEMEKCPPERRERPQRLAPEAKPEAIGTEEDRAAAEQDGETERRALPLGEAVKRWERLSRAAKAEWPERLGRSGAPERGRRGDVGPSGSWGPQAGDGRGALGAAGRSGEASEALQAERLDRAFQRDSRRYDGGFFLY